MAINPEDLLSTPAGFASRQQLAQMREMAKTLMQPPEGRMQSWTQPAAQIVNALLGQKMMNQAGASERAMAGQGLGGPSLGQPGPAPAADASGPAQQASVDGSDPASVRYNNPGAMYPGPSATKYGSTGYGVIGGGHLIAHFPDAESGAAAQFDLLARNYSGMTLGDAIHKWSGGNSSGAYASEVAKATGLSLNTVLTPQMLSDPAIAVPLAKTMAKVEAGKPFPMTDDQWTSAHARVFGGNTQVASAGNVQTDAGPPGINKPLGETSAAPAGAVSPTAGPSPQVTAQASPAASGAAQPSPTDSGLKPIKGQFVDPSIITRRTPISANDVFMARLRGDPKAEDLYMQYKTQGMPLEMKVPGGTIHVNPASPQDQWFFPDIEKSRTKVGDIETDTPYYIGAEGARHGIPQAAPPSAPPSAAPSAPAAGPPGSSPTATPPPAGAAGMPTDIPGMMGLSTQMTGAKKAAELDAATHNKIYTGIVGTAVNAAEQKQNINLIREYANDPGLVAGTGSGIRQWAARAAATLGIDPNAATPREMINMLSTRMLQQNLAALKSASSEVGENAGRIFATQVPIEEKSMPHGDDPVATIKAKLDALDQEGNLAIARAKMAHDYAKGHNGRIDEGFVQDYIDKTSKQRIQKPASEPGGPMSATPTLQDVEAELARRRAKQ